MEGNLNMQGTENLQRMMIRAAPAARLALLGLLPVLAACSSFVGGSSWDEDSREIHKGSFENATPFQRAHLPVVRRDGRAFTVTVPLEPQDDHRIEEIRVYRGNGLLGSRSIPPRATMAEADFSIDAQEGERLRFAAKCSLHGIWQTTIDIRR